MNKIERIAQKTPDPVVKALKKPVVKGMHYLMLALSPVRNRLYPRRFHAFCLGVPRTGTASMAGLFQRHYRAEHEPEDIVTTEKIVDFINGELSKKKMSSFIRKRDRSLWLELESSHFSYFYLDILLQEFEQAKFILLLRDCYSWLNSYINHQLGRPLSIKSRFWNKLRDIYFDNHFPYSAQEQVLDERGLYTIDGYLSRWKSYNEKVLSLVPSERLLVIRTHEIKEKFEDIKDFLGISSNNLDGSQSHLNTRTKGFDLLSKIDKGFLKEKFNDHCQDLMKDYFPRLYQNSYGIPDGEN
ncbi:MAG: hypothetical protein GF421_03200 [Candidatus Aminicenantes bacterium]|nr:hypothetical protein [Candidatus Aminicenantes bacterium]